MPPIKIAATKCSTVTIGSAITILNCELFRSSQSLNERK